MDFETVIYVLAGLAYLFFNSNKKNRKKGIPQTGQQKSEPQPAPFDWEKALKELTGETEESKPEPVTQRPQPVEVKEEAPIEYKSLREEQEELKQNNPYEKWQGLGAANKQHERKQSSQAEKRKPIKVHETEESEEPSREIDFDLREAVINSEILRRPDY